MTFCGVKAQQIDTFYLHHSLSKNDTIIIKRIIKFNETDNLFYLQDYYPSGQIKHVGQYSSFDKKIFEDLWCNYHSNTKEGEFTEWFENGQVESKTNYLNGLRHGLHEYCYINGQRECIHHFNNGQENGTLAYWDTTGVLERQSQYVNGMNQNPKDTSYKYLAYTPSEYENDTTQTWPLIIYLHGGTPRGNDLKKLYAYGIPDQIYRGREFPFIIISPQCPVHHRWSTDNWFDNFYNEITTKYRIDTNRVYLTGVSLGGAGTWYLATKYPDKFAAIAPMCGFTHHLDFIEKNINNLRDMPIWAFLGQIDKVVQFEDSQRIIKMLDEKNDRIKFTTPKDIGHWIHWTIYPKQELYDWFLKHNKRDDDNNNGI